MVITVQDLLNCHPDYYGSRWRPWKVVDSYRSWEQEATKFAVRHEERMTDKPLITPFFTSYEQLDEYMMALVIMEQ